jgi:curli production assembly/transport component CsgG
MGCRPIFRGRLWLAVLALLAGCSTVPPSNVKSNAQVTPTTRITNDLTHLPPPKRRLAVAVYGFRDQTGQYKPSPDSSYSTSVTQGAAAMLVKALKDSGWFVPVEREGLQNLLTERKIVRAIESPTDKGKPLVNLPNLIPASLIVEGGVIAYESNVRTGGKGANYLGIGSSTQYRVDQVTVSLRGVDIRNGQVLDTVSVTKTIYSTQFSASVYKFVSYQHLLQAETGYTSNEPAQLAVREAIEAAVLHFTVLGMRDRFLELNDPQDFYSPLVQRYVKESMNALGNEVASDEPVLLRAPVGGPPGPNGATVGGADAAPEAAHAPASREPDVARTAEASAPPSATRAEAARTAFLGGKPDAVVDAAQPAAAVRAPVVADAEVKAAAGTQAPPAPPVHDAGAKPPVRVTATPKSAPAATDDIFKQYWKTQGTPR